VRAHRRGAGHSQSHLHRHVSNWQPTGTGQEQQHQLVMQRVGIQLWPCMQRRPMFMHADHPQRGHRIHGEQRWAPLSPP